MLTWFMRTIEFYRTLSGDCPVEEFLDSLSDRDAQKVAWVLRLVERLEMVPQQYLKRVAGTHEVWEVRSQVGGSSYRLLGFFYESRFLILTNGFSKKRQKTPMKEIELAQRRRAEYLERKRKA